MYYIKNRCITLNEPKNNPDHSTENSLNADIIVESRVVGETATQAWNQIILSRNVSSNASISRKCIVFDYVNCARSIDFDQFICFIISLTLIP